MISVLDRRVPAGGRTPARDLPWVSARSVGDFLLVAVVSLAALVVYALHGLHGYLSRDLGVFVYGGEHVARGIPPYSGIFNSVGPLADAVPGLAIRLGASVGLAPVPASRLFFLGLSVACVALVFVLTRDTFGSRGAGLVGAGVFLTFTRFLQLASDGPREKTTMVLALLGCLVLLGRRRFVGAGVCTALATLAWQPALLPAVVAAVAAVLLLPRGARRRAAFGFVAGGAVPSAVAMVWFALTGTLATAFGGFLIINLLYTHQPSPVLQPTSALHTLWHAYGASLLLVPVGIAALVVLAVRDRRLWPVATGGVAATAWSAAVLNGGPDLFVILPFAAVGVAGLVVGVTARLAPRLRDGSLVVVAVAAVVLAGHEAIVTRSEKLLPEQTDVAGVLATQPSGATVLSVDAPEVLALAGRDNPTPYQLFSRTMMRYLDHTLPGGMQGYAARVAALQPTFVAVGHMDRATWADPVLARDYWRVGAGPGWVWYLDRAAGRPALQAARAANTAVMDEVVGHRFGAARRAGQSAPS